MSTSTNPSKPPHMPRPITAGPPQSRLGLIIFGGTALAAGSYYLYTSGGDRHVAKKQVEHDAAHATSRLKQDASSTARDAKLSVEEQLAKAGSKVDTVVEEGKSRINQAGQKLEQKKEQITTPIMEKIDEADRKIEQKAAQAKGGIGSWFGFGGK